MDKLLNVEIDRALWDVPGQRPGAENQGMLYRAETSRMCCLGFVGLTCGLTRELMRGMGEPTEVPGNWPETLFRGEDAEEYPGWLRNSRISLELMLINDDKSITNKKREKDIHETGLKAGINFTFTGEYLRDGEK